MKKTICCILLLVLLFSLASCDMSHLCSLDILCSNDNASIVVDGEKVSSFNFSTEGFNILPKENYSKIDFSKRDDHTSHDYRYKFKIASSTNGTYKLSLKLIDDNKQVRDFLRVAIIVDNELTVYKYYDIFENIYHRENDPDSILHFNSKHEIFNELPITFFAGEEKEITIFIWIEESELYDRSGERYTGWKDKSYYASPIMLGLDIK